MKLTLVTPEKKFASEEVSEVTIPGIYGEFGPLPGHTTFLTALGKGPLTYKSGATPKTFNISGGFCEVREDSVTLLADHIS